MEDEKKELVLPFEPDREYATFGIVICVIGNVVLTGMSIIKYGWKDTVTIILQLIMAGILLMALGVVVARYFARLRIAPDGVTVMLFGRVIRHYPAEKIGLFCGMRNPSRALPIHSLILCCYTQEEIIGMWEAQLRKNRYDRDSVPFRKMVPGWKRMFVGEYLFKRIYWMFGSDCGKDILRLNWSPEYLRLLEEMYPWVRWMDLSEKGIYDEQRIA